MGQHTNLLKIFDTKVTNFEMDFFGDCNGGGLHCKISIVRFIPFIGLHHLTHAAPGRYEAYNRNSTNNKVSKHFKIESYNFLLHTLTGIPAGMARSIC